MPPTARSGLDPSERLRRRLDRMKRELDRARRDIKREATINNSLSRQLADAEALIAKLRAARPR